MSFGGEANVVYVVVPPRALLLDVAGPIEVLRRANLSQDAVRFEIRHVSPERFVESSVGLPLGPLDPMPETVEPDAMILVSGRVDVTVNGAASSDAGDDARVAEADAQIVAWLARIVSPRHTLVCICSGALLAGRAGLLDRRLATTHHACIDALRLAAPLAEVVENRLFVEDGNRFTSAGVTAGIDLMLYILSRDVGPQAASDAARHLVVYLRRGGQDPQLSPWLEGRNHIHPVLHRIQDAIVAEPTRGWTMAELASLAGASPRNLSRLFKAHAGMTLPAYINLLRVALAAEMLTNRRLDMEVVAERSGFSSTRQLRRVWGRYRKGPPSDAREAAFTQG